MGLFRREADVSPPSEFLNEIEQINAARKKAEIAAEDLRKEISKAKIERARLQVAAKDLRDALEKFKAARRRAIIRNHP